MHRYPQPRGSGSPSEPETANIKKTSSIKKSSDDGPNFGHKVVEQKISDDIPNTANFRRTVCLKNQGKMLQAATGHVHRDDTSITAVPHHLRRGRTRSHRIGRSRRHLSANKVKLQMSVFVRPTSCLSLFSTTSSSSWSVPLPLSSSLLIPLSLSLSPQQ